MKANKIDPGEAKGLAQLAPTEFYKEVHVKLALAQVIDDAGRFKRSA